jgi:hypothetical protein
MFLSQTVVLRFFCARIKGHCQQASNNTANQSLADAVHGRASLSKPKATMIDQ